MIRSVVVLILAWGCGGSSNYFQEDPEGASGKGGSGQGGSGQGGSGQGGSAQGGSTGVGGVGGTSGGVGGTGGASGGVGGASGGTGGAQGGDGAVGGSGGVGGAVGGGAGSPVGGFGGEAAGQGGTAGAPGACTDGDAAISGQGASVRSKATGTNGSFTDECDSSGNLLEYVCEMAPCVSTKVAFPTGGRGQGGASGVTYCPTGQVISQTIDCGGHCDDGACFGWCATQGGEEFHVTGVEGSTLTMTMQSYSYSCIVAFQREGYDCLGQELVGRSMIVTSLGTCAGGSTTWGWDDPESASIEECAFTCTLE